ncbi:MAG: ABC transporter ATP-binding protein [Bacilli bacterium]|nr:ABC transporter ATP-binding protein [Bacilli bacterium]
MSIVKVEKINKKFGKKQVLYDVSFEINEGEILGFIGPNGAGKTTTIKLMLGLQEIDSGTVTINGYDLKKDFENAIRGVGGIIESPDMYMYLTGRQNLNLIANLYKGITKKEIDDLIKIVGLEKRINDKVSKYSLGMRQRLGIAAALINKPNVLILDEPTNGLDPQGIVEIRELIKKLAKEKKMAIMISSHNLSELDNFITDACIIQNGKVLSNTSIKKLKSLDVSKYRFKLNKTKGLKTLFANKKIEVINDETFEIEIDKKEINGILKKLISNDYEVYSLFKVSMSLEEAFLKETGGNSIE